MIDLKKINSLNKSEFITIFGNVFEKSEWILERAFDLKPFKDLKGFKTDIIDIFESSDNQTVLEILNLHPELVIEKKLTADSEYEQSEANLKDYTNKEFNEFKKLNFQYRKKFNFPFIIAVKGKKKNDILTIFKERIKNTVENEFLEAKRQVKKIALFRLEELVK